MFFKEYIDGNTLQWLTFLASLEDCFYCTEFNVHWIVHTCSVRLKAKVSRIESKRVKILYKGQTKKNE